MEVESRMISIIGTPAIAWPVILLIQMEAKVLVIISIGSLVL